MRAKRELRERKGVWGDDGILAGWVWYLCAVDGVTLFRNNESGILRPDLRMQLPNHLMTRAW